MTSSDTWGLTRDRRSVRVAARSLFSRICCSMRASRAAGGAPARRMRSSPANVCGGHNAGAQPSGRSVPHAPLGSHRVWRPWL